MLYVLHAREMETSMREIVVCAYGRCECCSVLQNEAFLMFNVVFMVLSLSFTCEFVGLRDSTNEKIN